MPRGRTVVDDVEVLGTDAVDEDDLLDKLATEATPTLLGIRLPWTTRSLLDTHVLERDVRRVGRYYRARGYYDARVVSSEILPDGDEVDIRIAVEEGQPVRVRGLQVQGLEALPRALRQRLRARVQLRRGEPFDEGLYDQTKERLLRTLRNEGYARAGVSGQVTVATDAHQADVTLTVRPGPVCRLRGIHIRGLVDVRASRVRVALGMRRGDKFSDRAMESAQAALFGLGVFQSVQVRPEVDPDEPYVDVIVEVAEAGFGRFRAGGGVSADRDHTSFHLTGGWEHRNMFGGLQRLTITHRPGLSISPGIFDAETLGFDNGLTVDFQWPGFPERETTFLHHGSYDAGLDTAADLCRHDVRLTTGLSRALTKWLRATVSHEMQLFVPVEGRLFFPCEPFPQPLPAVYESAFLSYLSETLVVDFRDDPFNTRRGFYASLKVSETPPGLGSDLGFLSLLGDARAYVQPLSWLGFATRLLVGRVFPLPADRPLPSALRFFGGGASDLRGYDTRTIGHYTSCPIDDVNQDDGDDDGCVPINEGGDVMWELSLEARFRVIGDLGLVAFLDVGDVFLPSADTPVIFGTGTTTPEGNRERFDLRRHHASIGIGIRYKTPVGPLRFDVAGRLPGLRRELETPEEQDFLLFKAPVTLHFTLGESY